MNHPARRRTRVFAILQNLLSVHKNMNHAGAQLMWSGKGRVILDRFWIKDDNICVVSDFETTTFLNA